MSVSHYCNVLYCSTYIWPTLSSLALRLQYVRLLEITWPPFEAVPVGGIHFTPLSYYQIALGVGVQSELGNHDYTKLSHVHRGKEVAFLP